MTHSEITNREREIVEQNGGAWDADYHVLMAELGIDDQRAAWVIRRLRNEQVKHRVHSHHNEKSEKSSAGDFDKGFGIGGLGRYEGTPIVPTAAAIERVQRMEDRARYCRRCGESDVFDGAMFTTAPSSGLCDDCCF